MDTLTTGKKVEKKGDLYPFKVWITTAAGFPVLLTIGFLLTDADSMRFIFFIASAFLIPSIIIFTFIMIAYWFVYLIVRRYVQNLILTKLILSAAGIVLMFAAGLLVDPDFGEDLFLNSGLLLFLGYAVIHIVATWIFRMQPKPNIKAS